MASEFTVADKLDEARKLVEAGWCQGSYERDGCYCVYGAIGVSVTGEPDPADLLRTKPLENAFAAAVGVEWHELAEWNDDAGRTQGQVVAAFKRAAALARENAA